MPLVRTRQLISLPSFLFLFLLLSQSITSFAQQKTADDGGWTDLIRQIMPGVVSIIVFDADGKQLGTGSGFVVGPDGIIVTNYHVIQGASAGRVITRQGEKFDVKGVIAFDRDKDFAILKIPAFDLTILRLGNSNTIEVGESVLAIGDPKGVFTGTVSAGIISAKMRELEGSTWIQTSTPVSHGNSGGPLLNRRAEVIGVISRGKNFDGQNFNFAVPINYVRGSLQLGTAIKHELPQLARIEVELTKVEAEAEAKKKAEEFRALFAPYEDPNGIFKLLVPKIWRIQRARNAIDNGHTAIETVIAPESATLAELGGYLSDGIRIYVLLPPAGSSFTIEGVETYKTQFPESVLKGNPGFELTNTGMFLINDMQAKVYTFEGKGARLPEPEKTVNYVFGNQKAIVHIEVVQPKSQVRSLELFSQLAKSFELSMNFRGESSGLTPVPRSSASSGVNTVTLKEVELSFRSNLIDDTIRNATRFLETTPDSKEAHTYLGLSLLIKKDVENGVLHLERAILLGEPITLPVKRLREPLIGHALDDATVTLSRDSVIIQSGNTSFQTYFSGLSESTVRNYENQCSIVFMKGVFTESSAKSAKSKQVEKGFNLFPPSTTLRQVQQGQMFYNVAACNDEGFVTVAIAKLAYRLMSRR